MSERDIYINSSNAFLDACQIYGSAKDRKGLEKDIDMSMSAKSWILDILKKDPDYNGRGQVVKQITIRRPIDEDYVWSFSCYLEKNKDSVLQKSEITDEQNMAVNNRTIISSFCQRFDAAKDDIIIKGKTASEWCKIADDFMKENTNFCFSWVTKESYEKYKMLDNLIDLIRDNKDKYLTKSYEDVFPNCQAREGIKTSRVVLKVLNKVGFTHLGTEDFNKRSSTYFDAISPLEIPKWFVISVNFCDYISMCNGNSWTSCLTVDKESILSSGMWGDGFNSRRVLDYALDPSTIVVYTVDEDYDGKEFELQAKCSRQLFHFNGNKLIQSRMYPQDTVSVHENYTLYREIIERVLIRGMDEANLWSAPKYGTISLRDNIVEVPYNDYESSEFIDFLESACHGGTEDMTFKNEINYTILKGASEAGDNGEPVEIGSIDAVCIICGDNMPEYYHNAICCSRHL